MRTERGATLMELLIAAGIVAVLGVVSVLGAQQLSNSYRVRAAARQVMSDFQFARVSAVKEGRTWAVCFTPGDTAVTSYRIINDPAGCASASPPVRTTNLSGFPGVAVAENFTGTSVAFGSQGTATPTGTMTMTSPDGARTLTVSLGAAGNPRIQ
jgi:Tfp pilus assembly protein FimT